MGRSLLVSLEGSPVLPRPLSGRFETGRGGLGDGSWRVLVF